MDIDAGTVVDLPPGTVIQVARYRHKVFIDMLGWRLAAQGGLELDQFDRADTIYVVARNDDGEVVGSARLLPTTRPYLLGEIFPQLLDGAHPPCSPKVWELSRFAAVDFNERRTSALSQFSSSSVAVELLHAAIRAAAERGAERLITVSPIGIERLLRKAGFHAHRAGPPVVVDGHPLFACYIECESESVLEPV